jgi:hypothetical protein
LYPGGTPGACRVVRGNPLCLPGRQPSPYSNRVGSHIGLFRGLHSDTSVAACLLAEPPEAARCLEGFDGFVTCTADPIATEWSDQLSGRESHPLEIRALARRTAIGTPSLSPRRGREPKGKGKSMGSGKTNRFLTPLCSPRPWAAANRA